MEGYFRTSLGLCELFGCVIGIQTPSHKRFQSIGWHIRMSQCQNFKQRVCCLVDLCVLLGHFVVCHLTRRGGYPLSETRRNGRGTVTWYFHMYLRVSVRCTAQDGEGVALLARFQNFEQRVCCLGGLHVF